MADSNDSSNVYNSKEGIIQQAFVVANCILNLPLMVIAILGNALVVATILKTRCLQTSSFQMLCSLAVTDFLVGCMAQPFFIASELTMDPLVERLSEVIECIFCGVSLSTMTAISLDRFLVLHYPMRYNALIVEKSHVVSVSIIAVWISNVLLSGLYFWNWTAYFTIMAIGVCLCIFISTISFIKIYQVVRKHRIQIHAQQQAVAQSSDEVPGINILRMKRSALNTFIFYIAMILCYLPVLVSMSISSISYKHWTKIWHLAETIVFINSSINPVLYIWRLSDLRAAVLKTLKKFFSRTSND
ncbi:melanocyte-stimulating hormone receptor-like [Montipora foliosa]|uniref:melanocyte-stimulating hormone receptor-like n=1 Tax=Montipora foliosa TaxID=591990 RepID=UPI0035F107BC